MAGMFDIGSAENGAPDSAMRVKSADRVLDILEALREEPSGLGFPDLMRRLNLPKSSLHGLLGVLVSRQYLVLNAETRRYSLGVQLFEHGQSFLKQHAVAREARVEMAVVVEAVNESAQLGLLRGADGVNLATVECSHPLRMQLEVGRHFAAHATSIGKCLLAHLPESDVRERVGEDRFRRFTEHTILAPEDLIAELRRIRHRGFSLDTEECIPGVFCVGVPIMSSSGSVLTAMSVTIPTSRLNERLLAHALSSLAAASMAISRRMGAQDSILQLQDLSKLEDAAAALRLSPAKRWLEK